MTYFREITWDDLDSLALGVGVLATGGGGDAYLGLLNARKMHREGRRFQLVDPAALDDDDLVAEIGFMGAPLVGQERLVSPEFCTRPVRAMSRHIGRRFDAVMSAEIGGMNGLLPLLVAATLDIPVVDADPRGRAFPEMQMSGFPIQGLPLYPVMLSDIRDNDVVVTRSASPKWTERMLRQVCAEMGSRAALCRTPRTGKVIKEKAILGTVSKAIRIGTTIRAARAAHTDPVHAVVEVENGVELLRGKVVDVMRRTTAGFLRGTADFEGLDGYAGRRFRVDFQNEYIFGWLDEALAVMVPDLICILDAVSGEAVGTETIRYGQRVAVLSLPANKILTSAAALAVVGPRAFGYDRDFVSLHREKAS